MRLVNFKTCRTLTFLATTKIAYLVENAVMPPSWETDSYIPLETPKISESPYEKTVYKWKLIVLIL